MESYYPVVVERYEPVMDTGGAGLHRGGCGIEKQYMFRRPGAFTVNDDRAVLDPWGIGGGDSGGRSGKVLVRADGTREELASKLDNVPVQPGDRLIFRTAGAGGWGDPLERDPALVERDVRRRLVSKEAARELYGVVVGDAAATAARRAEILAARKGEALPRFDFGELPAGLVPPR
jgi:N-methylhydantoinase B